MHALYPRANTYTAAQHLCGDIHNVINQHLSKNSSTPVSMASKSGRERAREASALGFAPQFGRNALFSGSALAAVYNNVTAALMIVHPQTNSKNNTKQSSQPEQVRGGRRRRSPWQVERIRLPGTIAQNLAHVRINQIRTQHCVWCKIYAAKRCSYGFAQTQFVFPARTWQFTQEIFIFKLMTTPNCLQT